jgi:hypothetical protein
VPDPTPPAARVLDLFAVPDDVHHLPGGSGGTFLAGDLVLSPGRGADLLTWLSPILARLSVTLEEDPVSRLRVALPIPARDGAWVVDGWAATRFEPGLEACDDLEVTRRAGRLLHARLDERVRTPDPSVEARSDRWAQAERMAFGEQELAGAEDAVELAARALAGCTPDTAPRQLVHADLAGNVLLDPTGSAFVVDFSPAWRSAGWAEAVCVLDSVLWQGADPLALGTVAPEDLRRAVAFRVLSDRPADVSAYAAALVQLSTADSSRSSSSPE